MPNEQGREINTYNGENKIQPVDGRYGEPFGEEHLYLLDNPMQRIGRNGSEQPHEEREDERELPC